MNYTEGKRTGAIFTADMDGSNGATIAPEVAAELISVDAETGNLLWYQQIKDSGRTRCAIVMHSNSSNGTSQKTLKELNSLLPAQFGVARDDLVVLFESDGYKYLVGFNKATGDYRSSFGAQQHHYLTGAKVVGFRVSYPNSEPRTTENPCRNSDCSHICAVKPGNTFKCLCPHAFLPLPDKPSCGKTVLGLPNLGSPLIIQMFSNLLTTSRGTYENDQRNNYSKGYGNVSRSF